MGSNFQGILVAVATPMSPDGDSINLPRLRRHVDWLISKGVHGLVMAGSTGEFAYLTDDERRAVVETGIEQAAGRVPVIVHCGAMTTADAIGWARHAAERGAAGLMCVPPWYGAHAEDEVYLHYKAISEAAPLDIIVYNIPSVTGFKFESPFLRRLAAIEHVRYVKDSSGDMRSLQETMLTCGDVIRVFNGMDDLSFQAFASGTEGTVWGAANLMPAECVRLFDLLHDRKDLATAWELWVRMWPICRFLETQGYARSLKAGLAIIGQDIGGARRPSQPLPAGCAAELRGYLAQLAAIPEAAAAAG